LLFWHAPRYKPLKQTGVEAMKTSTGIKSIVIGTGLTLATVFGAAHVATAQHTGKTTKANPEANPLAPAIREGGFGKAAGHSGRNKLLVVQISGPNVKALKTEAQEIYEAFKNTSIPTNIVVFYQEQKDISKTLGSIAMNGDDFKLPSGARNFDVATLKKYADTIVKYYRKNYTPLAQTETSINSGEKPQPEQP
jgi:hypothetical protein